MHSETLGRPGPLGSTGGGRGGVHCWGRGLLRTQAGGSAESVASTRVQAVPTLFTAQWAWRETAEWAG